MGAALTRARGGTDEQGITDAFARESLTPQRWSNSAGDRYAPHSHRHHKVLYCLAGSITFALPATGESYQLTPGDRLDIEPHTLHSAVVGPAGVVCIEGARH
jgi:quercetin dioxygenase-like cupin family protein